MAVMDSSSFVGVYGSLSIHDWLDAATLEEDAYSLFHARAVSLGWAIGRPGDPGSEHWGMNDAGQDWTSDGTSTPLAWFQVCLPEGSGAAGYALPVQALLACAEDSIERVGRLRLDAVQVLVQVWRHPGDRWRLASGLNSFELADPSARVPVRVIVDSGEDEVVQQLASRILEGARRRSSALFSLAEYAIGDLGTPRQPVVGDLWLGDGRHPVTFTGEVPEWGIAAAGWLVEFVVDVCREAGVRSSVLVTVEPDR